MNKIKELRKKAGLNQVELASKLKVVQSTVAMWETEKNLPSVNKLPQLAKALNCEISDLFETQNA